MVDLSIVITSYNRRAPLCCALASFEKQTYPMNRFEVIVVDDGSTDGTVEHLKSQSWNITLRVIRSQENLGISAARNLGIQKASGKIIVFSDSDMIVPPTYVERHWKMHRSEEKRVVSAPFRRNIYTEIYPDQLETKLWKRMARKIPELQECIPENFHEAQEAIQIFSPEDVSNGKMEEIMGPLKQTKKVNRFMKTFGKHLDDCAMPWLAFAGSNSSVPRDSLLEIDGFDEDLRYRHDDRDVGYQLYLSGHRFCLEEGIIGIHQDHFREKDRKMMLYYSIHDLAIMLNKCPHRDIYLFGLYQTNKAEFNPPMLAHLKQEMMRIEISSELGKIHASRFEQLLRHYVWTVISQHLGDSPLVKMQYDLKRNFALYQYWAETLRSNSKRNKFPLFVKTTNYLVDQLVNSKMMKAEELAPVAENTR